MLTDVQGQEVQVPLAWLDGGYCGSDESGCRVVKAGQPVQAAGTLARHRLKSDQPPPGTDAGVVTQSPEGQDGQPPPVGLVPTMMEPL